MVHFFGALIASLALILNGCAKKNETDSNPPTPFVPIHAVSLTPNHLIGTWGACMPDSTSSTSSDFSLTFSSTNFVQVDRSFSNTTCSGTPDTTFQLNGTYTLNTYVAGSFGTGIDFTLSSAQLTANSATAVNDFNSGSTCGFTNWQLNMPVALTPGNTCLDSTPTNYSDVMGIEAGILYYANSAMTQLEKSFPLSRR